MIAGGNWWRANEIVICHHTRQTPTRYRCRDRVLRCARELAELIEACDETIPFEVCEGLAPLVLQLRNLDEAIAQLDRMFAKLRRRTKRRGG